MMSAKRSPNLSSEKSFRIDDLLQRKTCDDENGSDFNITKNKSRHSSSVFFDSDENRFKSSRSWKNEKNEKDSTRDSTKESRDTALERAKMLPIAKSSSTGSSTGASGDTVINMEISSPASSSSSSSSSSPSGLYIHEGQGGKRGGNSSGGGSPFDTSIVTHSSSPYPAFNLSSSMYEAQHEHLMSPLHLQFNGINNVFGNPAGIGMSTSSSVMPNHYVTSSTSTPTSSSVGLSGQSWNSENNTGQGMSHFPVFPNFLLPSHHNYLIHPNGHPGGGLWPHGAHPALLTGSYLDPRSVDRGLPYSAFLNRLASPYGVPYGNGRLNPLMNIGSKRKGGQIRFSNSQTAQLEKAFFKQKYLNAIDRKKLAHSLALSDRQVKTWFQNRRAKSRKIKDKEDPPPGYTRSVSPPSPSQPSRSSSGIASSQEDTGNSP